ncbi:MAG TPA: antitoxin family protein [Tepidisphaeraceae bacterium]|jgi:predicted DNA-binding antitoxin AbrB/MazE fold protein
MTNRFQAVFENGVFRPVEVVTLKEGTRVEVISTNETPLKPPGPLVEAIERIAAMPLQGPRDGFSGANHDDVLYGKEGAW